MGIFWQLLQGLYLEGKWLKTQHAFWVLADWHCFILCCMILIKSIDHKGHTLHQPVPYYSLCFRIATVECLEVIAVQQCTEICRTTGNRKELSNEDWWYIFVFRWCIPLGARRIMNAVKDGHKSTLTSGKMVALAAGLTVGATAGYIIYRHVSTSKTSECCWEGSTVVTLTFGDQWWSMLFIYRSGIQCRGVKDDASYRGL